LYEIVCNCFQSGSKLIGLNELKNDINHLIENNQLR